jgi:hypothetical protein
MDMCTLEIRIYKEICAFVKIKKVLLLEFRGCGAVRDRRRGNMR